MVKSCGLIGEIAFLFSFDLEIPSIFKRFSCYVMHHFFFLTALEGMEKLIEGRKQNEQKDLLLN
jgi:hypothetical protein